MLRQFSYSAHISMDTPENNMLKGRIDHGHWNIQQQCITQADNIWNSSFTKKLSMASTGYKKMSIFSAFIKHWDSEIITHFDGILACDDPTYLKKFH